MNARVTFALSASEREYQPAVEQWFDSVLSAEGEHWLLSSGRRARAALSCLLVPANGDRVVCTGNNSEVFITAIVQRSSTQPATLGQLHQPLRLHASELTLSAGKKLLLGSAGDCDINTVRGSLSINCHHLITQVAASWIQSAAHCVARFGDLTTTVKQLLRTHAQRQLITAEKELKVDADVIHMG
jgi:hypothetical protein